jgi:hypothetical protein
MPDSHDLAAQSIPTREWERSPNWIVFRLAIFVTTGGVLPL